MIAKITKTLNLFHRGTRRKEPAHCRFRAGPFDLFSGPLYWM